MPRPDYTEYEKRRAESHEFAWRIAAMLVNIRNRHCRLRQCRRLEACSGPMLPSDHQLGQVRAQQDIGLTGKACASLPLCVANATPEYYAFLRTVAQDIADTRDREFKNCTDEECFYAFRREVRMLQREKRSAP